MSPVEGEWRHIEGGVERAMKVQEVILRAMAKKITWWQAAEIIGLVTGRCGDGGSGMKSEATTG